MLMFVFLCFSSTRSFILQQSTLLGFVYREADCKHKVLCGTLSHPLVLENWFSANLESALSVCSSGFWELCLSFVRAVFRGMFISLFKMYELFKHNKWQWSYVWKKTRPLSLKYAFEKAITDLRELLQQITLKRLQGQPASCKRKYK